MKVLLTLSIIISLSSCSDIYKIRRSLTCSWGLETITVNDEEKIFEYYHSNLIIFSKDSKLRLPSSKIQGAGYKANWSIYQRENIFYISVYNTSQSWMRREFKVEILNSKKLILTSGDVRLECLKLR